MSQSTEQRDILNTQTSAEQAGKLGSSTELRKFEPIENTPFVMVSENNDTEHYAVMGSHQMTTAMPSKEAVTDHIKKNWWQVVLQVVLVVLNDLGVDTSADQIKRAAADKK